MKFIYIIWGLLPSIFVWLIIYEYMRRASKAHGREDVKDYLSQLFYTSLALAFAILFDQYLYQSLAGVFGLAGSESAKIFGWLQYPLIIVLMLQVSSFMANRKEQTGSRGRGTVNLRR